MPCRGRAGSGDGGIGEDPGGEFDSGGQYPGDGAGLDGSQFGAAGGDEPRQLPGGGGQVRHSAHRYDPGAHRQLDVRGIRRQVGGLGLHLNGREPNQTVPGGLEELVAGRVVGGQRRGEVGVEVGQRGGDLARCLGQLPGRLRRQW